MTTDTQPTVTQATETRPSDTTSAAKDRWPVELRLKEGRRTLEVTFDDGLKGALPAELLRVYSPSAEVQGHGSGPKMLVLGKEAVQIQSIDRVGTYAVRLVFDDGHDTGFYTWAFLADFAQTVEEKRTEYTKEKATA
ncbi:MAG: gamma-butyrobetaine hydroxylase-like domain-containing protein [Pseudomonadota bacterium]